MSKKTVTTEAMYEWFNKLDTKLGGSGGVDLSQFDGLLDGETAARFVPVDAVEAEASRVAYAMRKDWTKWAKLVDPVVWPDRDVVLAALDSVHIMQVAGCKPIIVPLIEHYLRKTIEAKAQELDATELAVMLDAIRKFDVELAAAKRWNTIIDELDSRAVAEVDAVRGKELAGIEAVAADIVASCYGEPDVKETPPEKP